MLSPFIFLALVVIAVALAAFLPARLRLVAAAALAWVPVLLMGVVPRVTGRAGDLDLDAVLPLSQDSTLGQRPVLALGVLVLVSAVASTPALRRHDRNVLVVCAALLWIFVVATILRNGLWYIPSAVLLTAAARHAGPRVGADHEPAGAADAPRSDRS